MASLGKLTYRSGFTLVELIIVVAVIAILATISIIAYNGVQGNARDNAVLSDVDGVDALVARYATQHNGQYGSSVTWYSLGDSNANVDYTPSDGNVVDVAANDTDYCIRAYNPAATTYYTIHLAYTKGSSSTACYTLPPSSQAIAESGEQGGKAPWLVSAGYLHVCAVTFDQTLYCWGSNQYGQRGDGTTSTTSLPTKVVNDGALANKLFVAGPIMSSDSSYEYTCALSRDYIASCWGRNGVGQLGNGSTSNSSVPVAVSTAGVLAGAQVTKLVSAGNEFSSSVCALTTTSLIACWGFGGSGQLGNGSTSNSSVPVAVSTAGVLSGKTISDIQTLGASTCVLATDGRVYCWGDGSLGQLGNGSTSSSSVPVAVTTSGVLSGKTVTRLLAASGRFCVITSDSQMFCWGFNSSGRLGNGSTTNSSVPVAVTTSGVLSGKTIKSAAMGAAFTCVVASDDKPYCWGSGVNGELGNNASSNSSVPVAVTTSGALSGKTIKSLAVNPLGSHICAIASDDRAYCWGSGADGRLGNGSTANGTTPSAVSTAGVLSGKSIRSLAMSGWSSCALTTDNGVYCWGQNGYRQLGNGSSTDSSVPVAVGAFQ